MIELQQFLLWLVRKFFTKTIAFPKRWHDRLTDIFEYEDWIIPVFLLSLLVGGVGLALGIFLVSTGHSELGAIVFLSIVGIGAGFIVSTAVRYMYRVFKQEQQELIKALKQ